MSGLFRFDSGWGYQIARLRNRQGEYDPARYLADAKAQKARVYLYKKSTRDWLQVYKSTLSCAQCGESHPACLDFHHNRDKDSSVADMAWQGFSKDRILSEIAKCVVLCANCHRKIHYIDIS